MKKLTTILLTLSLTAAAAAAGAQASDRINNINNAIQTKDEIHIIYNDSVVQYEDVKPVNTDGRVMIPFRAALENMGAEVDYNDAERRVTAKKGDITINFVLMDDTIYIDNAGQQSTITMDVPMIIVDDRTLVPIRFMSNAFGMQVGWDGPSQTVVIMDYDDYFNNIGETLPNLSRLARAGNGDLNKLSDSFDISLAVGGYTIGLKGTAETEKNNSLSHTNMTFSTDNDTLRVDNASAELISDGSSVYIKTDALKKLAESTNSAAIKAAAILIDSDKWYSMDLDKLLGALGFEDTTAQIIETALLSGENDLKGSLMSGITLDGDADYAEITELAAKIDMYELADKYVTFNQNGDGTYSAGVKITPENFAEIITASLGTLLTDDEKNNMLNTVNCGVDIKAEGGAESRKSEGDISLKVNSENGSYSIAAKISEDAQISASAPSITVPKAERDITSELLLILGL